MPIEGNRELIDNGVDEDQVVLIGLGGAFQLHGAENPAMLDDQGKENEVLSARCFSLQVRQGLPGEHVRARLAIHIE